MCAHSRTRSALRRRTIGLFHGAYTRPDPRHCLCPPCRMWRWPHKEAVMKRLLAVLLVGMSWAGAAAAQEATSGPGTLEITLVPGGGTFYTSSGSAPSFGNYTLGAGVAYNINRIVGIE